MRLVTSALYGLVDITELQFCFFDAFSGVQYGDGSFVLIVMPLLFLRVQIMMMAVCSSGEMLRLLPCFLL